ncbi:MAG: nucleotidyltransferase family protein [Candidatus Parvarchaeota archaeon]|jgi:hypothetical protein|nr:nucleotidyltransferase family protein [Candidatus Parvarchaeota archaeon]MCL5101109.1 nucleotidyltransferase family protein [Candidatus Parvarchaeota archaeon]
METTIKLTMKTKAMLEKQKIHRREPYEEVVLRLLQSYTRRPAVSKTNLSLQKIKDTAVPILKKYGIEKAAIFGSFARGDARPDSDIDILIKRPANALNTLLLIDELKSAFEREIDLVTYESLDMHIKDSVIKESLQII